MGLIGRAGLLYRRGRPRREAPVSVKAPLACVREGVCVHGEIALKFVGACHVTSLPSAVGLKALKMFCYGFGMRFVIFSLHEV